MENTCNRDAQCELDFVKCGLPAKTRTSDEIFNLQRPRAKTNIKAFFLFEISMGLCK